MNILDVFGRIANLSADDSCLFHQQLVIYVNIFGPQMESVSPKIVKFVHIDAVSFVADDLKLPLSFSCLFSMDQIDDSFNHPFSLLGLKAVFYGLFFHHVFEDPLTSYFVWPLLDFLWTVDLYGFNYPAIKSMTVGSMTDVMKQSCKSDG